MIYTDYLCKKKLTPYNKIRLKLSDMVEGDMLPAKWELIGEVLILRFNHRFSDSILEKICNVYAEILKAKTVFIEEGTINGEFRTPQLRLITGKETLTTHRENKIIYKLDVQKIMFSSGNKEERKRMATIAHKNETVIDMFAGIGYFSIPMAKYSRPKSIHAIEKSEYTFQFLEENIRVNKVGDIVVPHCMDNRDFTLDEKVDRIVMGCFDNDISFFRKALSLSKANTIIHYHALVNRFLGDNILFERLEEESTANGYSLKCVYKKKVKSVSRRYEHWVYDLKVAIRG